MCTFSGRDHNLYIDGALYEYIHMIKVEYYSPVTTAVGPTCRDRCPIVLTPVRLYGDSCCPSVCPSRRRFDLLMIDQAAKGQPKKGYIQRTRYTHRKNNEFPMVNSSYNSFSFRMYTRASHNTVLYNMILI